MKPVIEGAPTLRWTQTGSQSSSIPWLIRNNGSSSERVMLRFTFPGR